MDILRVENLCKVYGKGDTAVRALDNVSFTIQKGGFRRHRRPVRFRQIHPSAHSGRGRHPLLGKGIHRQHRRLQPERNQSRHLPPAPDRPDLSVFQPRSRAERGGKHHPAPSARRPEGRQGLSERPDGDAGAAGAPAPPAKPALGRPAAAGLHRPGAHQQPLPRPGRRADRQSGQ